MRVQIWEEELQEMVRASVHFGHPITKSHPKMMPYIFAETQGTHIIDITKTIRLLEQVTTFVRKASGEGKQFLLVGTNDQTSDFIASVAQKTRCHYVNTKWLGGMLTNWSTIQTRLATLKQLEMKEALGILTTLPKKEAASLKKQLTKLRKYLNGIKYMTKLPDVVILINQRQDNIAIQECNKLGIPIICIVDTDCDPSLVDMPIPANDDATSSIQWVVNKIISAIEDGREPSNKLNKIANTKKSVNLPTLKINRVKPLLSLSNT